MCQEVIPTIEIAAASWKERLSGIFMTLTSGKYVYWANPPHKGPVWKPHTCLWRQSYSLTEVQSLHILHIRLGCPTILSPFLYVRHFLQYLLLFPKHHFQKCEEEESWLVFPKIPNDHCNYRKLLRLNLIILDFWNFYVFYLYNFSWILIMLTIYSCLHISIKTIRNLKYRSRKYYKKYTNRNRKQLIFITTLSQHHDYITLMT